MFHVKCIDCKNFSANDGCKLDLDDENCNRYEKTPSHFSEQVISCDDCVWQSDGFCDFDENSPLTCRKFKSKKEDF